MHAHPTDRVVLVAAGFGVWYGGRHQASARWGDVVRVRAFIASAADADRVHVGVVLRNGTEVVVHEQVPGYQAFVGAAESALPGMRRRATWLPAMQEPSSDRSETVLFERGVSRA